MAVGKGRDSGDGVPSARGDLPELLVVDPATSIDDDGMDLGRGVAPHGSGVAACGPAGDLRLSVLLRPRVPMQFLVGLPAVCALGSLEALRGLGAAGALIGWPGDIVVPDPTGAPSPGRLAGMLVKAGTGEAGVFAACGLRMSLADPAGSDGPTPADDPTASGRLQALVPVSLERAMADGAAVPSPGLVASAIRDSIVARCDAWATDLARTSSVAGPLVPVLSDYVDALALMGQPVGALTPDGRELARGILCGMDVWGRATVRDAFGDEHEFAAEQASLFGLPRG